MTGFATVDRDHAQAMLRAATALVSVALTAVRVARESGDRGWVCEAEGDLAHFRTWRQAELRRFVGAWGRP